jgi:MYXO-CTERM domain-containing protein
VRDTDGDGYDDGLEAYSGSDPNDAGSFPDAGESGGRGCSAGAGDSGGGAVALLLALMVLVVWRLHGRACSAEAGGKPWAAE